MHIDILLSYLIAITHIIYDFFLKQVKIINYKSNNKLSNFYKNLLKHPINHKLANLNKLIIKIITINKRIAQSQIS